MKTFTQLLACLLFLVAFTFSGSKLIAQSVTGSGNVIEQERSHTGFNAIQTGHGVDVFISQGSSEKVIVKADDNLVDYIKTSMEGNTLVITAKGNIRRTKAFDVYVTVKNLERVKATSGSDVESQTTLSMDKLELEMHSGSDVEMDLEVGELHCDLSGGSDADLSGTAKSATITASGGSDINAKGLKIGDCKLDVSGGSDANIYVTGDLEMEATGTCLNFAFGWSCGKFCSGKGIFCSRMRAIRRKK